MTQNNKEFESNVTERIAEIAISLAWRNSNFVCSECLRTMKNLIEILGYLDTVTAAEVITEIAEILDNKPIDDLIDECIV